MKPLNKVPKLALIGLLSLSSAVALSACNNSTPSNTAQTPTSTTENSVATTPTSTASPVAATTTEPTTAATTTPEASATTTPEASATTTPEATASNPAGAQDVVKVAATNDSFKTFTKAVEAAGLTDTLSAQGPYTVFAPTDEAFAALPAGTLDKLLQPENKETLVKVLTYHVVPGRITSEEIASGEVKTVEGGSVTVKVDKASNAVDVNGAMVTKPDIEASNGVIHAINKVILPPDVQSSLESKGQSN